MRLLLEQGGNAIEMQIWELVEAAKWDFEQTHGLWTVAYNQPARNSGLKRGSEAYRSGKPFLWSFARWLGTASFDIHVFHLAAKIFDERASQD